MSVATIFSYTIIYTLCVHAHLCPTLCNSTDCSLPGFSVHGILQARILASAGEVAQSCPTVRFHGLKPTRLLHPWNFPGKSSGVGCHFLLQGIFPTRGSNPGLPHCSQTLYRMSYQGSPKLGCYFLIYDNLSDPGIEPISLHLLVWQTLWQTLYQFITKILVL